MAHIVNGQDWMFLCYCFSRKKKIEETYEQEADGFRVTSFFMANVAATITKH